MNDKKYDVLCIGMFCIDIIVGGADLAAFQASQSEAAMVECLKLSVGGDAANEAITLSQLGRKAGVISEVRDDRGGRFILDYIAGAGVDVSHVGLIHDYQAPTPPSLVFVQPDAQRRFMIMKDAEWTARENRTFTFDEAVVESTKILSFATIGGYPMQGDDGVALVTRTAKRAKTAGAVICADIGSWKWRPDPRRYREMYAELDYIFPNKGEALTITGAATVAEAADIFLDAGVGTAVIKVGADGCYIKQQSGRVVQSPAFCSGKCVDTTGAGDNFAAGFISALLDGMNLEECARFANATASVACSVYGANYGVRSKEQVLGVYR